MRTKTLFADGKPVASYDADSAADAKIAAKQAALVAEAERRGVPAPEFTNETHDDARKAAQKEAVK